MKKLVIFCLLATTGMFISGCGDPLIEDDLLYDDTGECHQTDEAWIDAHGYEMRWDGCRLHNGKLVHYVRYATGPYQGNSYAVHEDTDHKSYILREGEKVILFN